MGLGVVLLAVALTALPQAAAAKSPSERLLAYKILHPAKGGHIRAPNGAQLYVPPKALSDDSLVTITRLWGGRYDFHINQPWTGSVRVTLPPKHNATYVMHRVGGVWVREGARGRRSVWVEQLSPFSWLIDKLKLKACLTRNPAAFLNCLKKKGISKLSGPLVEWFLNIIPNDFSAECKEELKSSTAVEILYQIVLGSKCMPRAGEGPPQEQPPPQQQQPPPQQPPPQQPPPQQPPPASKGFSIADSIYGGTWARLDPNNGTWYSRGSRPPNGKYWFPNGLGVAVDCARSAAAYPVVIYGQRQTWSWWAHVTDNSWVPIAVFSTVWSDGNPGVANC